MHLAKLTLTVLLSLGLCLPLMAQLSPIGTEGTLNTTTAGAQKNPAVGMNPAGAYAVAWQSLNQDGSGYAVVAKTYDHTGAVVLSDFVVNSTTLRDQRNPDIAITSGGNLVIVWQSLDQDGAGWGVYYTLLSPAGAVLVGETLVNTTTAGNQRTPQVGVNGAGAFAISWESEGDIYLRTYNDAGGATSGEILVNTTTTGRQMRPAMDINPSTGAFVVAWQSQGQDGDQYGIYGQRFTSAGVADGSEFGVNVTTAGNQIEPAVAVGADGSFIIAWASYGQDGSDYGVYARTYEANGTPISGEVQVNATTAGSQQHVDAAPTSNFHFILTWTSYGQDGEAGGIYSAVVRTLGTIQEAESIVNTTTLQNQMHSAVASSPLVAGSAQFVWQSGQHEIAATPDGSGYGIQTLSFNTNFPFPVELLAFEARRVDEDLVQLSWETANEQNNLGFEVEISPEGVEFTAIGFVEGAGNSDTELAYTFPHLNREGAYYRLRQVDYDGSFTFSPIRYVAGAVAPGKLDVYPNPTTGMVTIDLGAYQGSLSAVLWAQDGKRIWQGSGERSRVNLSLNQVLSQLPQGAYQLIVITDLDSRAKTLVKYE